MKLFRSRQSNLQSDIVHSTGFAEAADRGTPSLGSASPETFSQRQAVDRNRQHISRFQDARMHYDYREQVIGERPAADNDSASQQANPTGIQQPSRSSIPRTSGGFREPSSRGFNPFK